MIELNTIHNIDCLTGMMQLPDNCIDCCVTSPPYYGLRDYGHEGQIGLEETPEQYVEKIVAVFEQVRRVLKPDGTLWLNLGDTYAGGGSGTSGKNSNVGYFNKGEFLNKRNKKSFLAGGLKPKDLIGIPWMVAFALRSAGWYLRQDIIWHKPNPMPESVTDRCTKAHEYIFLLSKSGKYYFDQKAILKPIQQSTLNDSRLRNDNYEAGRPERGCPEDSGSNLCSSVPWEGDLANKRSIWTVTTKPLKEAHFATFPEDLIVDCIKAGCPENGIVLDPFMGAGTTALVSRKLNRNFTGFELNKEYIKIAETRLKSELGMFI